jgi:hypothetical protein
MGGAEGCFDCKMQLNHRREAIQSTIETVFCFNKMFYIGMLNDVCEMQRLDEPGVAQ